MEKGTKRFMKWVYKLERKFGRICIPHLMLVIIAGQAMVYLANLLNPDILLLSRFSLNWAAVMHGEVWRLLTFVFIPQSTSPLGLVLTLYFYYLIGNTLENTWGDFQFNVYYLCGMLGAILAAALTGYGTSYYINLSLFFAFAMLYPDFQVLLFFIIPIKMKWLAIIDALYFVYAIIQDFSAGMGLMSFLPLVALLNYFLFCGGELFHSVMPRRRQQRRNTVDFKREVHRIKYETKNKNYMHKCAVCGRTDADHPELEVRYCSRCAGYHCFCQDHINNHVHFTE